MGFPIALRCNTSSFLQHTSCSAFRFQPLVVVSSLDFPRTFRRCGFELVAVSRFENRRKIDFVCKVGESQTDGNAHSKEIAHMKMPGRKIAPIQSVKIKKIPSILKNAFMEAVVNKAVDIVVEAGEDIVVNIYEKLEGPLGDFFDNVPNMGEQVGDDAIKLAEEAFEQAIHASETVVRAVVHGSQTAVYVVEKGAEKVGHEVGHFVVHSVGEPIVHEFDKVGKTVINEGDKFIHSITRKTNNLAHTVDHVFHKVGGFFSRLF